MRVSVSSSFALACLAFTQNADGFSVGNAARIRAASTSVSFHQMSSSSDDALNKAIEMMTGGAGGGEFETPDMVQARIQLLVDENPVLLFMKGARSFPQCGFSDTATKILESFDVDFHTVDVLADLAIREGVKSYSEWPTIPQLYVNGEFIGGSDIMIELYQTGELKQIIEQATADKSE